MSAAPTDTAPTDTAQEATANEATAQKAAAQQTTEPRRRPLGWQVPVAAALLALWIAMLVWMAYLR